MRHKLVLLTLILLIGALLPPSAQAGGWATITVVDLPRDVQAGEPVAIEFVVRQHGHPDGLMTGLSPTVRASLGDETVEVAAVATDEDGRYRATLVFPTPGAWTWSIAAFTMEVEMPPLTVGDDTAARALSLWQQLFAFVGFASQAQAMTTATTRTPAAYGRDLFIAKGCVTCHTHDAAPGYFSTNLGPNLSDYDPNPEFVRVWLRNAADLTSDQMWPMPSLELTDEEIDALVAFLAA